MTLSEKVNEIIDLQVVRSKSNQILARERHTTSILKSLADFHITGDVTALTDTSKETKNALRDFVQSNNVTVAEVKDYLDASFDSRGKKNNPTYKAFSDQIAMIEQIDKDTLFWKIEALAEQTEETKIQARNALTIAWLDYYLTGNADLVPDPESSCETVPELKTCPGLGRCMVDTLFSSDLLNNLERTNPAIASYVAQYRKFKQAQTTWNQKLYDYIQESALDGVDTRAAQVKDALLAYFADSSNKQIETLIPGLPLIDSLHFIQMRYPFVCTTVIPANRFSTVLADAPPPFLQNSTPEADLPLIIPLPELPKAAKLSENVPAPGKGSDKSKKRSKSSNALNKGAEAGTPPKPVRKSTPERIPAPNYEKSTVPLTVGPPAFMKDSLEGDNSEVEEPGVLNTAPVTNVVEPVTQPAIQQEPQPLPQTPPPVTATQSEIEPPLSQTPPPDTAASLVIEPPPPQTLPVSTDAKTQKVDVSLPKAEQKTEQTPPTEPLVLAPTKDQTPSEGAASLNMRILGACIAALGIVAVALAFAVLGAATLAIAGTVVAAVGAATLLTGIGLFSTSFLPDAPQTEAKDTAQMIPA